jgi:hypothetical protein
MTILVTFTTGGTFEDRARDMHNAIPRAEEWARQANVASVKIVHCQQVLWES